MNKFKSYTTKKLLLIISAFFVSLCMSAQAVQRNILLLIGDDIGIDGLHFSNTNSSTVFPPIPTIELLAKRGIILALRKNEWVSGEL